MCHPIKRDLPTNRFRTLEDFATRMKGRLTMDNLKWLRQARFQLNPKDKDSWDYYEFPHKYGLLDKLMAEIPGKDNYQGNLVDDAFDLPAMKYNGKPGEKVNVVKKREITEQECLPLLTRCIKVIS